MNPYDWNANDQPGSSSSHAPGIHNSSLSDADAQIRAYASYLRGLSSTASFGEYTGSSGGFSYTANSPLTVLDFESLTMIGGDTPSFALNGRPGQNDAFVIRISGNTLFEGSDGGKDGSGSGVPLVLSNLDRRNVIWLTTGENSEFDLHRNGYANFEGIIISEAGSGSGSGGGKGGKGGDGDGDGEVILGEVNFTGQVYAANMKLGSGLDFEGASITDPIPEPSSSLLLLGATGLLAFRRRR